MADQYDPSVEAEALVAAEETVNALKDGRCSICSQPVSGVFKIVNCQVVCSGCTKKHFPENTKSMQWLDNLMREIKQE